MIETFTSIATSFGLPVALLGVLAFFCYKMWNTQQEQTKEYIQHMEEQGSEREQQFFQQLSGFQAVLEQFQQTLDRIDLRLEYLEKNQEKG